MIPLIYILIQLLSAGLLRLRAWLCFRCASADPPTGSGPQPGQKQEVQEVGGKNLRPTSEEDGKGGIKL